MGQRSIVLRASTRRKMRRGDRRTFRECMYVKLNKINSKDNEALCFTPFQRGHD